MGDIFLSCFGQVVRIVLESDTIKEYICSIKRIHVFPVDIIDFKFNIDSIPSLTIYEKQKDYSLIYNQENQSIIFDVNWEYICNSGTIEKLIYQLIYLSALDKYIS